MTANSRKKKAYSQDRADDRWEGEGGSQEEAEEETPQDGEPEGTDQPGS